MSKHLPRLAATVTNHPVRWAGLDSEIRRFDLVLATAPDEIVDKCKTITETVLKTILVESSQKNEDECDSMDMEGLKVCVSQALGLSRDEDLLIKAELTYVNAVRNSIGVSGHGRSLSRQSTIRASVDPISNDHLLQLVDNLLSQLIIKFELFYPLVSDEVEPNEGYDDYLNSTYEKYEINEATYLPSEILFSVDPNSYKNGLAEFEQQKEYENE